MTVSAYTPNFRLALIDFNSQNWHGDAWDNLNLIDAILKADFASAPFCVATGTNTLALDYTPNVTSYYSGQTLLFKLSVSPTGPMTINADGLGAKALKIAGADVNAGDLAASDVVRAIYDGAQFNVVEPVRVFTSLTLVTGGGYGGAGAAADRKNLVINSTGNAGISILTPSTGVGILAFGDPVNSAAGYVSYNHNTDTMIVTSGGAFLFTGNYTGLGAYQLTSLNVTGGITGNLTGNVTGDVSGTASNVTGIVAIAKGGTGASDIATARTNLGLGTLATLSAINDANWSGTDLSIVNGGTGASSASVALSNLGAMPLAGGAFTGPVSTTSTITKSGAGDYLYHMIAGYVGGIKIQAQSGATTTGFVDGNISFEY